MSDTSNPSEAQSNGPDKPGLATTNWATELVKQRKAAREARKQRSGAEAESPSAEPDAAGTPSKMRFIVAGIIAAVALLGGLALALR
jgi:hypothetical protein